MASPTTEAAPAKEMDASSAPASAPSGPGRPPSTGIRSLPFEIQISALTYLRATDLSALQRCCRHFHDRSLINGVIRHTAERVYPPGLTDGYDTPAVGGSANTQTGSGRPDFLTYEMLRNMEMLVVARVLSRPEPPLPEREAGFYVSKAWCRVALRWLEAQEEERKERHLLLQQGQQQQSTRNPHASKKKKKARKPKRQERIRSRKLSEASPPWANVNQDIACGHGDLARQSSKSARTRRRILDKQAWRVLNRLYPDSVQLSSSGPECIQCLMEAETAKKTEADRKQLAAEERKRPLGCPIVRGVYTRNKGLPQSCLASVVDSDLKPAPITPSRVRGAFRARECPLVPGVYNALPRSWCHRWRRYLKTGEGERPEVPDASALLCEGHTLPLVPPHLEAFLFGDSPTLLCGSSSLSDADGSTSLRSPHPGGFSPSPSVPASPFFPFPVGYNPVHSDEPLEGGAAAAAAQNEDPEEEAIVTALRAAGLSEAEVQAQRQAMISLERQSHMAAAAASAQPALASGSVPTAPDPRAAGRKSVNEELDRENYRVVEILTDEEVDALEKWWPKISSNYALRFAVTVNDEGRRTVVWSTSPCRECDASGKNCQGEFVGRTQRARRIRRKGTVPNGKGR